VIAEARREAPARVVEEESEESTYSSDRGMESAGRGDDRGRRGGGGGGGGGQGAGAGAGAGGAQGAQRRRRRAKPEAIQARLRGPDAAAAVDTTDDAS
jgi:small subunit ribosomal protein S2